MNHLILRKAPRRFFNRISIAAILSIAAIFSLAAISSCVRVSENVDASVMEATGGGHPHKGMMLIHDYGCGTCHDISGVPGAHGLIGPSLDRVGSRMMIGGVLTNTPDNLMRWIKDAPGVDSLTVMPNMGVTDQDARDIAAYLYTLR